MADTKEIYSAWLNEHYEITNDGRVISYKRQGRAWELTPVLGGKTNQKRSTSAPSNRGYPMVRLITHDGPKWFRLNRLIAICFHGLPPTDKHVARHLDGNTLHNHYKNIAWGTVSDNAQDAIKHGTAAWTNKQLWSALIKDARSREPPNMRSDMFKKIAARLTPEQKQAASQRAKQRITAQPLEQKQAQAALARRARHQQITAQKAELLQKINKGRTRPYLDAGHNNGPQLDLFEDHPNTTQKKTER